MRYFVTVRKNVPTGLYSLEMGEQGLFEKAWDESKTAWVDCNILVGWLFEGKIGLEEIPASEAEKIFPNAFA